MVVTVSLGGSFIFTRPEKVLTLGSLIRKSSEKFIIVCGGGGIAREYIEFAKKLRLKTEFLHEVGILSTHLNAKLIAKSLGGEFSDNDPRGIKPTKKLLVMGGYKPGWTTDTCSAYAAVSSGSKIIFNLSKEKNVYDKDPSKYKTAKPLKNITFRDLYNLTPGKRTPGMNFIFDPLAGKICEKKKIKVVVTDDIVDITRYLHKKQIKGTLIE